MLSRRPFRADGSKTTRGERARIQARLDALDLARANADTREIGALPAEDVPAYDGSLAHSPAGIPQPGFDVEIRAYLLTADGGILAEIPCQESAGPITIGRGRDADVRIDDPYVHRLQAELRWDDEARAHFIAHGGGENGTYVNRHRVTLPIRLAGGESLRFGKSKLLYRIRR